MPRENMVTIENARMIFKNFRGEKRVHMGTTMNEQGKRNFNLILSSEDAERLGAMGFNVRVRPPRNDEEEPQYLMKVNVNFETGRPPVITQYVGRNKLVLDESTVGELDYADIQHVDLTVNAYRRQDLTGRETVTAYLHSMHVVIEQDAFADKYAEYGEDDRAF